MSGGVFGLSVADPSKEVVVSGSVFVHSFVDGGFWCRICGDYSPHRNDAGAWRGFRQVPVAAVVVELSIQVLIGKLWAW